VEGEAVRLTALQTLQQPNIQRLGIANDALQNLSALLLGEQLTRVAAT